MAIDPAKPAVRPKPSRPPAGRAPTIATRALPHSKMLSAIAPNWPFKWKKARRLALASDPPPDTHLWVGWFFFMVPLSRCGIWIGEFGKVLGSGVYGGAVGSIEGLVAGCKNVILK